ncbi:hypothetical protein OH77DRAFT_1361660, partial [Trametes cingulata]
VIHETDSRLVMDALTKHARRHEDTGLLRAGYILQKNAEVERVMLAAMRGRRAAVALKWVKGHSGHQGNEEADRLAAEGALKESEDELDMTIPDDLRVTGAKLSAMTQKLAYKAIRARKAKELQLRQATERVLTIIKADIERVFGRLVTTEEIWTASRKTYVTREYRQFAWKVLHDAFMVGKHWLKPSMPDGLKERAICKKCAVEESMEHILLQCRSVGRERVWGLLRELW